MASRALKSAARMWCSSVSAPDCVSLDGANLWHFPSLTYIGGAVLLILAIIYVRHWRKTRAQEKLIAGGNMVSIAAPLITRIESIPAWSGSGHSYTPSNEPISPYTPYSPYSSSDHSHLPILSADGHLLPSSPELAWSDDNHVSTGPLPTTPYIQHSQYNISSDGKGGLVGVFPEQDIAYLGVERYGRSGAHHGTYHSIV
jgi:hypothetical protein